MRPSILAIFALPFPVGSAFALDPHVEAVKLVGTMAQLESLELGSLLLPDVRVPLLKDFAFLKSM